MQVFMPISPNLFMLSSLGSLLILVLLYVASIWHGHQIPANLNWFGWCTWDAFYKAVNPAGIEEGLKRYMNNVLHFIFHTIMYVILEGNGRASFASFILLYHLPMMHFFVL